MEGANFAIWQTMTPLFLLCLMSLFFFSPVVAREVKEVSFKSTQTKSLPKTYVVHVKKPAGRVFASSDEVDDWYMSFLPSMDSTSNSRPRLVYSYKNVFSGFAAKMTADEAKAMTANEGFVSAREEKKLSLHTTHTPSFLGLSKGNGLWGTSNLGKGVIIGLLDTGIFPNHPSFFDNNMPPPPAKWKGQCDFSGPVCNNKLIGARSFVNGRGGQPTDEEGHGTHTSSTAAGNVVQGAAALGNANGTAIGMAPLAHLAMYKVCSEDGCFESDILAGMDAAIEDGVDVLSLSLGGASLPFSADSIAIGAFAAIQKGIFVSCSAGNDGPTYGTLSNEAPWILTVGASTMDRSIRATAKLGDGNEYDGESIFQPKNFGPALLPLVYAGANGNQTTAFCFAGSLKGLDVKGKVVVCDRGGGVGRIAKGQEVKDAGGAAMILTNQQLDGFSTLADAHVLPATHVSFSAGSKIKAYISSTSSPMATILFKGTVIGDVFAPSVTSFSSRGPNLQSPGILKPDIIGPGVSILAAWPFPLDNNSNTDSTFNIISGTSMSCPHLSGIAALLKASHPDWSPAAIKSAIMTSSDSLNHQGYPIFDEKLLAADVFATGSGHVHPSKADDPGLIYDLVPDDYIPYLCGLNYTDGEIAFIVQKNVSCSEVGSVPEAQLNYPSFSVILGSESQSFTRTVTNVGSAKSDYSVEISSPPGVEVAVEPPKLSFEAVKETASYKITFSRAGKVSAPFGQGFINWVSDKYSVRTPLVVIFA